MNHLGIALLWCAVQVTLVGTLSALVYLAARRFGPPGRSLIALTGLLVILGLSALAFSPWPHWSLPEQSKGSVATAAETPRPQEDSTSEGAGVDASAVSEARDQQAAAPASRTEKAEEPGFVSTFWQTFTDQLRRASNDRGGQPRPQPQNWPGVLALVFLAALGIGAVRLVLGLVAVGNCRRRGQLVQDPVLLELADVLRAELGCRRPVELRESEHIGSPATVGWRRPVILLPAEWAGWTEQQRRAVLAHEIAHIRRCDFAAWVCAQVGLLLHFYHPLVHWLAGRLRLEQELAADAAAASLAGGRDSYLRTLAEMALRQSDRPVGWPARTFLPTRGTFLRRIEMLRDTKRLPTHLSATARTAAIGGLLLAGLAVAGVRGPAVEADAAPPPDERPKTSAAETKPAEPSGPLELKYIPKNAVGAMAAKPAAIYAKLRTPQLAELLKKEQVIERNFGIPLEAIEQVTGVFFRDRGGEPDEIIFIVRTKTPEQAAKLFETLAPKSETRRYAGKVYHAAQRMLYFLPDDRTLIATDEDTHMRAFIDAARDDRDATDDPSWMPAWKQVRDSQAAVAFDVTWVPELMTGPNRPPQSVRAVVAPFAPLWEKTRTAAAGISLDEGMVVRGIADTAGTEDAQRVKQTIVAVATLARNALDQQEDRVADVPRREREIMEKVVALGQSLLASLKVEQENGIVRLRAEANDDGAVALLASVVFPAVQAQREAARRTVSRNNLVQIALAMHNYLYTHKHFPPAAVIGPDGKTPHSWRVALLPYLDQKELYDEYRMNEPWDSPHNKKVLAKMPAVFRHPSQPKDSTSSAYYVLTGPVTIFPDGKEEKGTHMRDIRDGTSNTIMAVEAKRDIPWTKPEDIPYDPDKEIPKLGGFREGIFQALFGDGSVKAFSHNIDEKVLRGLITKSGGEVIPR